MMKLTILTVAGLIGVGAIAGAGAGVNAREARQKARIQQGIASGELTRCEAARLAGQQAAIRAEEYRYRHNDGRLSLWERLDLERDQTRASHDIFRQKSDGQER